MTCLTIIDFSKVFDSVDQVVLLSKLTQLNGTYLVLWLTGFVHFWLVEVSSDVN